MRSRGCSLKARGTACEAPGKLHQPWSSLHLQINYCLKAVQKKKIKIDIYLEPVMEGAVKGVSRIRKSLSEACVGVMT